MQGSDRAFPARPNEQELFGAEAGRKRVGPGGPALLDLSRKGPEGINASVHLSSDATSYRTVAPTISSQESGTAKGLLSTNLSTLQTQASLGLLLLFMCSHKFCSSAD